MPDQRVAEPLIGRAPQTPPVTTTKPPPAPTMHLKGGKDERAACGGEKQRPKGTRGGGPTQGNRDHTSPSPPPPPATSTPKGRARESTPPKKGEARAGSSGRGEDHRGPIKGMRPCRSCHPAAAEAKGQAAGRPGSGLEERTARPARTTPPAQGRPPQGRNLNARQTGGRPTKRATPTKAGNPQHKAPPRPKLHGGGSDQKHGHPASPGGPPPGY